MPIITQEVGVLFLFANSDSIRKITSDQSQRCLGRAPFTRRWQHQEVFRMCFPSTSGIGKKKQEAARVWRSPGSSVTWLSARIRTCKLISSVTAWFSHYIFYLFVFLRQQTEAETHSQSQHSCVSIFLSDCSSCSFPIAGVASNGLGMNRCDWNAMLLSDDWALSDKCYNYLSHVFRHSFHKQIARRHETLSWAIFVLTVLYPPGSFLSLRDHSL